MLMGLLCYLIFAFGTGAIIMLVRWSATRGR